MHNLLSFYPDKNKKNKANVYTLDLSDEVPPDS